MLVAVGNILDIARLLDERDEGKFITLNISTGVHGARYAVLTTNRGRYVGEGPTLEAAMAQIVSLLLRASRGSAAGGSAVG